MGLVPIYSIPLRYVHKFYILLFSLVYGLCLHIQFSWICAEVALVVLTFEEVLGVRSTGENNSLKSV